MKACERKLLDLAACVYFAAAAMVLLQLIRLTADWPIIVRYPLGFIKVSFLATFGEMLKVRRLEGGWRWPNHFFQRFIVWGLFGIWFTAIFPYAAGGTVGLINKGLWASGNFIPGNFGAKLWTAFSTSMYINCLSLFAWPMMIAHEYFNEVIARQNLVGHHEFARKLADNSEIWFRKIPLSIIWFWVPAHTVTFCLDPQYRVLMAAVLSVALGFILTTPKK